MVSVLNLELNSPTFFPPGSLESQLDSLETSDLVSLPSPDFDSPESKTTIIDYIEVQSPRKVPSKPGKKCLEISKTPNQATQKFETPLKTLWESPSVLASRQTSFELMSQDLQEELALLKVQVENYKQLINEYENSLKMINSILEGVKNLASHTFKSLPAFDSSNLKTSRQSLESISLYINNLVVEKSIRKHSKIYEGKRVKCLKLDNVYPSIIIPESPEPPKQANLIRRQNSIVEKDDWKRGKLFMLQEKNFKSVSPILKMKYKPNLMKGSRY
jgi:hypothetical protein